MSTRKHCIKYSSGGFLAAPPPHEVMLEEYSCENAIELGYEITKRPTTWKTVNTSKLCQVQQLSWSK
jgi:hypothetical protein